MEKGIVFDISHYMIEDGPGIRTNVFVKGCPLRCRWCSNAFGLERNPELSYQAEKCTGCGRCAEICPSGSISIKEGRAVQDFELCRKYCSMEQEKPTDKNTGVPLCDFLCIKECPSAARKQVGKIMTSEEVINEVLEDQIFYRRGGGGMTVSGGEILMQPRFVAELLKKGADRYLSNAIETSGLGRWDDLKEMIGYTDVVFMDIKSIDPQIHKKLTGVDNSLIIDNISKASSLCRKTGRIFVLRLPLVPGQNDGTDNLVRTAELAEKLEVELNVLPYHDLGIGKYERIGKKYNLPGLKPFTKAELAEKEQILKKCWERVSMGGYGVESY